MGVGAFSVWDRGREIRKGWKAETDYSFTSGESGSSAKHRLQLEEKSGKEFDEIN